MIRPIWVSGLLLSIFAASTLSAAEPKLSFNRDIRPILSDNCFQCHGPDEKQRQGKLRLDQADSATAPAESGQVAIVPKQPERSELVRRLLTTDKDLHMPPASSGKQLKPREIETLTRWVAEGADYQGHWAFLTPTRPEVPNVTTQIAAANLPESVKQQLNAWPRQDLDRFVLSKLLANGLLPSREASRETLIRRVSLDLTGLPPTPAEVAAFVADQSPAAYENLVDRLLRSPHYGERMALQWLDFARYADSNGFQVDSSRFNWPWRDWVIGAFNSNLPFDQFTRQQLAGDLLPQATREQIVATGFNRNHRLNGEGGIIAEEWRVETVIDRVETTGMTWLALTLNCCRCHDHKYDPISQKDFYGLFAFFNSVAESGTLQGESKNTDPTLPVPTGEQVALADQLDADMRAAEKDLATASQELPKLIAAWEPDFKAKLEQDNGTVWQPFIPASVKSVGGSQLTKQADGSYLAGGKNPAHDVYTIQGPLAGGQLSGLLLECLPDPSLPNQSLGRFSNGNFVLSTVEAEITAPDLKEPVVGKFTRAEATYSQNGWNIGLVLDGTTNNGWAVDGPTRRDPTTAMFLFDLPLTVPDKAMLTVRLKHEALTGHNIGRFRLSTTKLPPATVKIDGAKLPESLKTILSTAVDQRSAAQKQELEKFFRSSVDSPVRRAESALASLTKKRDDLRAKWPTAMVMKEAPQPREAFVLIRGEYDKRGEPVGPGIPKVFGQLPAGQRLNRLDLANWIVDRSNPLTARVWVNRAWERFFGMGLVKTTENFGSQAEWPSHLELLDWLAVEFMDGATSGANRTASRTPWDMRELQKLIVMSATYRQATSPKEVLHLTATNGMSVDPDNRLLGRGPRFRLSAEQLRDQALAVSGLLVPKIGGPSVRPYMPDGVWDETSRYGDLRGYKHDQGEGLYRRTLYTIWKRTAAPPSMLLFDAPSREICTVKRSRTNTPLQALVLLNEITYVEAARKLAERMLTEGGTTAVDRLSYGFQLVTSRRPTMTEVRILEAGLKADAARFEKDPATAQQLVQFGDAKSDAKFNLTELSAYTLAANVLLNLDEAVTRE